MDRKKIREHNRKNGDKKKRKCNFLSVSFRISPDLKMMYISSLAACDHINFEVAVNIDSGKYLVKPMPEESYIKFPCHFVYNL